MKKTSPFGKDDDEDKDKEPPKPKPEPPKQEPPKEEAKDDDSGGSPRVGNDRRVPGKAAESSRAKKVANDLKKAIGDVETDDLDAAASAAAEAVMSKRSTLREAAEDLVNRMNNRGVE